MRGGLYLYGAGSIAAGIFDLIWGDFEAAHQPIQALGDYIPGRAGLAYITALWLVAGGVLILQRRTARVGARGLAAIYFIFAVFWLPRFYTATHVLGLRIAVLAGLLTGIAQQLVLVAAAGIVYASVLSPESAWALRVRLLARWIFGLSSIAFGLGHLTGVEQAAAMVPRWLPFGAGLWVVLTGIAFVLGGIAILSGILDVLAARLLALMLLVFSVLVLSPAPYAHPGNHVAWGSNAYNVAAVGAFWMFAESIALACKGGVHVAKDMATSAPRS